MLFESSIRGVGSLNLSAIPPPMAQLYDCNRVEKPMNPKDWNYETETF